MISIHDPIHGTVEVSFDEIDLIDSRPFQRLRHIKQLGFSDYAFPGATHTRYAHSLGAMQMATRMVDRVLEVLDLAPDDKASLRQLARLSVLFHDLGHAPMSHVSEKVMPAVNTLNIPDWVDDNNRQATHEDYTVKLLLDSELTERISTTFGHLGISGERLAAVIIGRPLVGDADAFVYGGRNLLPLLHQIVSSEMDADRMDYLRRDAYYCGVNYGNYDDNWLTTNLTAVEYEGELALALKHRAVWAFENFLLARYHMFLAVYLHHTPVCFDHMLEQFFKAEGYLLPSDTQSYLSTDDIQLTSMLRQSKNPWAKSVIGRRAYRLLYERHDFGEQGASLELDAKLQEEGIDFFRSHSRGILSKYFGVGTQSNRLLVIEPEVGRISRIEDYTPLYKRFEEVVGVERLFCDPADHEKAKKVLASVDQSQRGPRPVPQKQVV